MTGINDVTNRRKRRALSSGPSLTHLTHNFGTPKKEQNKFLQCLGKPHLDSFNNFLTDGLSSIAKNLHPVTIKLQNGDVMVFSLSELTIDYPKQDKNRLVFPTECRQSGATYTGMFHGKVNWSVNGVKMIPINKIFGEIPIMVKSDRCHLKNLKPAQLIQHNEHEDEWGGYFILGGHERLIRMLLITRRNYPIAVSRKSWRGRGQMFSEKGIFLRSVADDETSVNNTLHYVNDGTAKLMFIHKKRLYYMPLCLVFKCLLNVTDVYIYKKLTQGYENDLYFKSCVRNMLHTLHVEGLDSHHAAKNFLGKTFRVKFTDFSELSDAEICDYILQKCIAVHLKSHEDKFNLLVFMAQKLFSFVRDECCLEGSDAVMFQEVLTGGSLYQQIISDKLQGYLLSLKSEIDKKLSSGKEFVSNQLEIANMVHRVRGVCNSMKNFLATGNINTRFLTGLPQDKGLTIVVENINRMRYMAHFKSIHRGAYFSTMRTSEPRALLPDSWGFICPVHTPDGAPCGLLNHLTKDCQVTGVPDADLVKNIPEKLYGFGVLPPNVLINTKNNFIVFVDGKVIGFLPEGSASRVVNNLRTLKVEGKEIPATTEIVFVPKKGRNSQFPGLFIFTTPGRMVRPVKNLALNKIELIGTFEQVYMDICIKLSEAYPGRTSHQEQSETSFLSNLASLIPMPDCNQSPRNIYQCQMGKQSMGTPCHTWNIQAETKLYRLLFPSSPLFRPVHYDDIELDSFPMGLNAVVAVVSYTGYDMEDAMIINKSSYERGFGHGCVMKSEFIELTKESYFEKDPTRKDLAHLEEDGLVEPGCLVKEGDPLYCYYDKTELKYIVHKSHIKEIAYIDNVRQFENDKGCKGACITFRIPRNPTVGDKFASRAGQKGICSQLWAAVDLPFTDSGMVPDIIFNPHGFPSRMTIAMMIELMAGKSAAIEGTVYDATPFKFSQNNTAINYFGKMLEAAGYSYYGSEKMYSGTNGKEMEAEIFFGIVYYQRLRHMVLDKWQVRSTGPVDSITQQPVQGRKRGGGIRVGEMERDALISHGVSALINDRLLDCSDRYKTLVCKKCNCLLSANVQKCIKSGGKTEVCRKCVDGGEICTIEIPYILRFVILVLFLVSNSPFALMASLWAVINDCDLISRIFRVLSVSGREILPIQGTFQKVMLLINKTIWDIKADVSELKENVDHFYLITNAIFVCLMQCGFACLEAGSVRTKNVTNIIMKNLLDMFISCLAYWILGYALAYGDGNPFMGLTYWAGIGIPRNKYSHWFFQFVFAATAATIVSGAVAERCNFVAYIVYSSVISGVIYPIVSHWVWAKGGWLSDMGYTDFAGSGAVHLLGGACSLIAALLLGPRLGRFEGTEMPGHSIPLVGIGGLILITGFLAFNGGSLGTITTFDAGATISIVISNTVVGGTSAAGIALITGRMGLAEPKSWNFSLTLNGALTGMVSVCAAVNRFDLWSSFLVGIIGGFAFLGIHYLMPLWKIDDPLDAVAVHLGGGLWGVLAGPIFKCNGIIFGPNKENLAELLYNILGGISIFAWSVTTCLALFGGLKWINCLRVTREEELMGLDISKHKELAYPSAGWDDSSQLCRDNPSEYRGASLRNKSSSQEYANCSFRDDNL